MIQGHGRLEPKVRPSANCRCMGVWCINMPPRLPVAPTLDLRVTDRPVLVRYPEGGGRHGFLVWVYFGCWFKMLCLCHHNLLYGVLSLTMYTSPTRIVHPTAIAMAMIGRFTRANSRRLTWICFLDRISRQSRPAKEALKAVLNAP